MYESFVIRNFRGFRELTIDGLERLTVITGTNNVGKSGLLEGVFCHSGGASPGLLLTIMGLRGQQQLTVEFGKWTETPIASLFHNFDLERPIELVGHVKSQGTLRVMVAPVTDPGTLRSLTVPGSVPAPAAGFRPPPQGTAPDTSAGGSIEQAHVLSMTYERYGGERATTYLIMSPQGVRTDPAFIALPAFPSVYLTASAVGGAGEDVQRFSKLEISRQTDLLTESLRSIEPRLEQLRLVASGGSISIQGHVGLARLLPLASMGEGMRRLTGIVLAIAASPDGVVCLDDVENGFHYSVLSKVWAAIHRASVLFNTQVFVTTHSLECLRALGALLEQTPGIGCSVHRLERKEDEIRRVSYDREAFLGALEGGFEVR